MDKPFVFISFHQKDEDKKAKLLSHLKVLQISASIDLWTNDRVGPGKDWEKEISHAIDKAKVAILLITEHFLGAELAPLRKEVSQLLERREREGLTVIPVIANPCAWETVDWLEKMGVRPKHHKPVWREGGRFADEDLSAIAKEIADIVKPKRGIGGFREAAIRELIPHYEQRLHTLQEGSVASLAASPREVQSEIESIKSDLEEWQTELEIEEEKAIFHNFWQIDKGEKLYCVISTLADRHTGQYKRRMTGFGEMRGYASVVYSLVRAYENRVYRRGVFKDARLYFSDEFPWDKCQEKSLILLGGDDKNEITEWMIDRIQKKWGVNLPCYFDYEPAIVSDEEAEDHRKYTRLVFEFEDEFKQKRRCEFKPEIEKDKVVRDFGMVARLPNPLNPHSKLFIFAGCHTYGTAAAAKAVAAKSILLKMKNKYYLDNKFFIAIFDCIVKRDYLHVDDMKVFCPLDEDTLKLKSDDIFVNQRELCKVINDDQRAN